MVLHAGAFQLIRLFVDECIHAILNELYYVQRWPLYRQTGTALMTMHPLLFLCLETTGCLRPLLDPRGPAEELKPETTVPPTLDFMGLIEGNAHWPPQEPTASLALKRARWSLDWGSTSPDFAPTSPAPFTQLSAQVASESPWADTPAANTPGLSMSLNAVGGDSDFLYNLASPLANSTEADFGASVNFSVAASTTTDETAFPPADGHQDQSPL